MSFRSFIAEQARGNKQPYTQRNYCRELLRNESIPLDSENADLILSAVDKCYPMNSGIYIFTLGMLIAYQNESRKKDKRSDNYLDILRDVYDRCDCYHDDGRTREQFRQRPELHLMAVIASGLFEIADAIRGK